MYPSSPQVLHIELSGVENTNPAGTHLNVCAILSKLGRHREAMGHVVCALDLLRKGLSDPRSIDGAVRRRAATLYNIQCSEICVHTETEK